MNGIRECRNIYAHRGDTVTSKDEERTNSLILEFLYWLEGDREPER